MDDNTEDGFENEENYYAFLNIAKSVNLLKNQTSKTVHFANILHQNYEI